MATEIVVRTLEEARTQYLEKFGRAPDGRWNIDRIDAAIRKADHPDDQEAESDPPPKARKSHHYTAEARIDLFRVDAVKNKGFPTHAAIYEIQRAEMEKVIDDLRRRHGMVLPFEFTITLRTQVTGERHDWQRGRIVE